jgi:hypothetical protein
MTAEVAVLNKTGVAIAADSAVTTGFPGREKIFTTANKIFTLSKVEPVGIMINGHVEHFGCPWEVIIKDFRARLGGTSYDDVSQYVDHFVRAMTDTAMLTEDAQAVSVLMTTMSTYAELSRRIERDDLTWRSADIDKALEEMSQDAAARAFIPGFEDVSSRAFNTSYGGIINDFVTGEEHVEYKLPRSCLSLFRSVVLTALTRQMTTQFSTGIVITGYGSQNRYPKLYELAVDGGFLGRVRHFEVSARDIQTEPDGAVITPFAQDDAVNSFLNGIDERFEIFQLGIFTHLIQLVAEEALRENSALTSDERRVAASLIHDKMGDALSDLQDEMKNFSTTQFRKPVLEVLRTAPKETLAELAESLVSIASLRQRVSGDLETVAGPIDVALISKGEGFIWIKRKHYFNTDLNPHYAQNYFRGI